MNMKIPWYIVIAANLGVIVTVDYITFSILFHEKIMLVEPVFAIIFGESIMMICLTVLTIALLLKTIRQELRK